MCCNNTQANYQSTQPMPAVQLDKISLFEENFPLRSLHINDFQTKLEKAIDEENKLTLEAFTEEFRDCIGFDDLKVPMSPFNLILKSKFMSDKGSPNNVVDIENEVSDELADDVTPEVCLEVENLQILGLFYCLGSKEEKSDYMYFLIKGKSTDKIACYDRNLYRIFLKMVKIGTLFVEFYSNPFSTTKTEPVLM